MGNKNRWTKTTIYPLHDFKFILEVDGEEKVELANFDELITALIEQLGD
jgi:hypothetical protein